MARFFEAIVVVGAGLSLSGSACGGIVSKDVAAGGATSGGNPGLAGSGAAGSSAAFGGVAGGASGSAGIAGSGASSGFHGYDPIYGALGYAGQIVWGGNGIEGLVLTTQWDCRGLFQGCVASAYGDDTGKQTELLLAQACPKDTSRPAMAVDCPMGLMFSCIAASYKGQDVLVNCECVAPNSGCTCTDAGTGQPRTGFCAGTHQVCPCAYAGILK
jgi:hypothetical protein